MRRFLKGVNAHGVGKWVNILKDDRFNKEVKLTVSKSEILVYFSRNS
jgi:hypothetical protein